MKNAKVDNDLINSITVKQPESKNMLTNIKSHSYGEICSYYWRRSVTIKSKLSEILKLKTGNIYYINLNFLEFT